MTEKLGLESAIIIYAIGSIAFIRTLASSLKWVAPQRRKIRPDLVWLGLLPVVHYVWMIVAVITVSRSLAKESAARGIKDTDCGEEDGRAYAILRLVGGLAYGTGWILSWSGLEAYVFIPIWVWLLFTPPAGICFVIYWVRIAGCARRLKASIRQAEDIRLAGISSETSTAIQSRQPG